MATTTFREPNVHQEAHAFVLGAYQVTRRFPREETYGLASQLRRAAVSIPANIAEGDAKRGRADKVRYYNVAQGSLEEARYYLILAEDLGYAQTADLQAKIECVSRLLSRYSDAVAANRSRLPSFMAALVAGLGAAGRSYSWLLASGFWLLVAAPATSAAPTQEDVFRSIQDNVGGEVDGSRFLYVLLGLASLIVLLALVGRVRAKPPGSKALNHQGKLLREVLKTVPLKGRELRQLKVLAEHADVEGPVASPLTLVLCPSVMARTMQDKKLKLDQRAALSVARKVGLQVSRKG